MIEHLGNNALRQKANTGKERLRASESIPFSKNIGGTKAEHGVTLYRAAPCFFICAGLLRKVFHCDIGELMEVVEDE